jgi:hypothetical protein
MWRVCSDALATQVIVALLRVSVVNRGFCGLLKFRNGVGIGSFPSCVLHKKSDERRSVNSGYHTALESHMAGRVGISIVSSSVSKVLFIM